MNKKIFILFIIFICLILVFLKIIINNMYPKKYSEYIEKYAYENNIDKNLIYAIIKQESNFKKDVNSNKGAIGLMQLMESTALEVAENIGFTNVDLFDPETNIRIGVKHFSNLLEKYENEKIAIIAYNAGSGNVDKWIENGIINIDGTNLENVPYKETNMYLRKVLKNYEIYNKLYQS